jgi:hypothetical protein
MDTGVTLLTLADPARPVGVGEYVTGRPVIGVEVVGDTLVILDNAGRVEWLNVADPSRPTRLALDHALNQPSALAAGGGLVAAADLTGGLFLWRPSRSAIFLPLVSR